jgi:hypothetical protein
MIPKIRLFISKYWFKISFFIMGIGSLIWFLVRVIPKPSRAQYPCMKAAAPVASSFISYILGISVFAFVFKKAKQRLAQAKYIAALAFVLIGLAAGTWAVFSNSERAVAYTLSTPQPVNQPIGEGKGVFPGRVVWAHDPNATNKNCSNGYNDFWFMDKNTNQKVVDDMLSSSIRQLTGASTDAAAWDLIFHNYNSTHERGNVGYVKGEKVVIKINLNGFSGSASNQNINTSPQICLSVLKHLVNVVGVDQSDIGIGDPSHNMDDETFSKCATAFPDVNYWGYSNGMVSATPSSEPVFFYSDGSDFSEFLPEQYLDATYMINIPVFKKHHRAGISICCKNHVGSISPYSSQNYTNAHWHLSLPVPNADGEANGEYGSYRCFVDMMGHKDLGGKTILYLVDGLWSSVNYGHPPIKWAMAPFNNDWPSSLFVSLDPVAIESVCFDFLYEEFDENHPTEGGIPNGETGPFPHFAGVDDYLHQAADSKNWPAGIEYDPEGDGTILKSMGTHEHWNNALDKKYSRNLSPDGKGIELYKAVITSSNTLKDNKDSYSCSNYPNPFKESTTISFKLDLPSNVEICIYDLKGQKISTKNLEELTAGEHQYEWNTKNNDGHLIPAGNYIYTLNIGNKTGNFQISNKMSVLE